ncbi:MAG TPA: hypothetical protein DDZ51_06665 [Planctomycetaceae bacterium]|nr:hypothetical protein [Planctomycetaceae bacterium]
MIESGFILATIPADFWLLILFLMGLLLATWAWRVHSDLTWRRERLRGLVADIAAILGESVAVRSIGTRHSGRASRMENKQRRTVARPKSNAGTWFDNNQYPEAKALASVNASQASEYGVQGSIRAAQQKLNEEAAQYNARLRSLPTCLIAPVLGFYPWQIRIAKQKPSSSSRPKNINRQQKRINSSNPRTLHIGRQSAPKARKHRRR